MKLTFVLFGHACCRQELLAKLEQAPGVAMA